MIDLWALGLAILGGFIGSRWSEMGLSRKLHQLDASSCSERLEAVRELFALGPIQAFAVLRDKLAYPDPCTFHVAREIIDRYPEGVADLLDSQPHETVREVLRALEDYHETHRVFPENLRPVRELTALLLRERFDSWWLAIVILGEIGPGAQPAVPGILYVLRQTDDLRVARHCVEALGKIGIGDVSAIVSAMADFVRRADVNATNTIREDCLQHLNLSTYEIRKAVFPLASDPSPRVREFARELLLRSQGE